MPLQSYTSPFFSVKYLSTKGVVSTKKNSTISAKTEKNKNKNLQFILFRLHFVHFQMGRAENGSSIPLITSTDNKRSQANPSAIHFPKDGTQLCQNITPVVMISQYCNTIIKEKGQKMLLCFCFFKKKQILLVLGGFYQCTIAFAS